MRPRLALLLCLLSAGLLAQESDERDVRATLQALVRAAERQPQLQQRIDGLSRAARDYAAVDLGETANLLERVAALLTRKGLTLPWEFGEALRALVPRELERAVAIRRRVVAAAARDYHYVADLNLAQRLVESAATDLPGALALARRYLALPGGEGASVEAAAQRLWWDGRHREALALAELVESPGFLPDTIIRVVTALMVEQPERGLAEAVRRSGREQLWYGLWHTGQASWQSSTEDPLAAAAAIAEADQPPSAEGALVQAALLRFAAPERAVPRLLALPPGEARTLGLAYHLTDDRAPFELRREAANLVAAGVPALPLRFQQIYAHHQLAAWANGAEGAGSHASQALRLALAISPGRWEAEPKRGPASMDYTYQELVGLLVRLLSRLEPAEALRLRPVWSRRVNYDGLLVDVAYAQAQTDLSAALATLRRDSKPDLRDRNLTELAIWLAADRPDGARAVAGAIGAERYRDLAWAGLAEELAATEPDLGEALLAQIGEPLTRDTARFKLARQALAAERFEKAERLALGIGHGISRSDALGELGEAHLAAGRLDQALRIAGLIGDAGPRSRLLTAIVEALVERGEQDEAVSLALAIPDFAARVEVLRGFVERLAGDRRAAVALIARDPSPEARQELMASLAETLVGTDPDEAYRFAGTIDYAPLREVVLNQLARTLVKTDLDRALVVLSEIRGGWLWSEAALPVATAAAIARRPPSVVLPLFGRLSRHVYAGYGYESEGPLAEFVGALAGWFAVEPAASWEPALRAMLPAEQEDREDRLEPRLLLAVIHHLLEDDLALAQRLGAGLPATWRTMADRLLLERLRESDPDAALRLARQVREPGPRAWRLLVVVDGLQGAARLAVLDEVARLARQVADLRDRLALQKAVAARR